MTRFSADVEDVGLVEAPRELVWAVLTDPERLARMVTQVDRIEVLDGHWRWHMRGFTALGVKVRPTFTVVIHLEEQAVLRFVHDELPGERDVMGVDGEYRLRDASGGGTCVQIATTVHVDLPLPRLVSKAVENVMLLEMWRTGRGFADSLKREVGDLRAARAASS